MKAVPCSEPGAAEVLHIGKAPQSSPGIGQVLVRVIATTVNRPDIVQREGNYPPLEGDSVIPGLEVAGTIEQLGDAVSGWSVGDRVMRCWAVAVLTRQRYSFAEEVRRCTAKQGVHMILNHIGAACLVSNMKSLAVGGRLVVIFPRPCLVG